MFVNRQCARVRPSIYATILVSVVTLFSACSQVPPPNPDPLQGWQGRKYVNGNAPVTPATELPFKIFADPAHVLYDYLRVKKVPGEKPKTFVKQGKDYSCSDLNGSFECLLTFDLTNGGIKNHHENIDLAAQFDKTPVSYGLTYPNDPGVPDDLLVITMSALPEDPADPSEGNYFDMKQDNGKLVYDALQIPVQPAFDPKNDWKIKNGKQVNCINPADGNYSCRIFIDWETGSIKALGASPQPDPKLGWQGTKVPKPNGVPIPELPFKIFADPARILYDYLKVKKSPGEKPGEFVKQGKDYSCSNPNGKFECGFTFDLRDGSVMNHIENIDVASQFDIPPKNYGVTHPQNHYLDDILILTVTADPKDPTRGNYFDIIGDNGEKVYDGLQVKVEPRPTDQNLVDWKVKNGKQVNCVIKPAAGYSCRILLDWETGSILPFNQQATSP